MVNPVHKGKRGENEFCEWLHRNLGISTERIYNQSSGCSADIVIEDFIIEVKRHEKFKLDDWWYQVTISKQRHNHRELIPIVAYRKNRQRWMFLLPANLVPGISKGYLIANERVFLEFARRIVD